MAPLQWEAISAVRRHPQLLGPQISCSRQVVPLGPSWMGSISGQQAASNSKHRRPSVFNDMFFPDLSVKFSSIWGEISHKNKHQIHWYYFSSPIHNTTPQ